ncbi:MAG: SMI1/KNR4 family protein [Verrucomicrobiota bacterium]
MARKIGKVDWSLNIEPPVSIATVQRWEKNYGPVPDSLKVFLLECAGGIHFFWSLDDYTDVTAQVQVNGGFCRINLKEMWPQHINEHFQTGEKIEYEERKPWGWEDYKVVFMEQGNGDYYAASLTGSEEVVYLNHETLGITKLGRDIFDFLEKYTALGCIEQYWDEGLLLSRSGISVSSAESKKVIRWLGL